MRKWLSLEDKAREQIQLIDLEVEKYSEEAVRMEIESPVASESHIQFDKLEERILQTLTKKLGEIVSEKQRSSAQ